MTTSVPSIYKTHQKVNCVTTSTNGISVSQHTTASQALTMTGTLCSGGTYTAADGVNCKVGHQLTLTSAGANDFSGVNFTFVGTDPDGLALSETIKGPNGTTVTTTNYFYTLASITPDTSDGAHNVSAGISNTLATQRVPVENRSSFATGIGISTTGTISITAQETMDDLYDTTITPQYVADATLATKATVFGSAIAFQCTGVRAITNSYSTGATFIFHVIQAKNST